MRRDQQRDDVRVDGGSLILLEEERDESTTEAILWGIAALKGVAETDLDPLYGSIEVDSMKQLLKHSSRNNSDIPLTFSFEGCTAHMRSNTAIKITNDVSHIG